MKGTDRFIKLKRRRSKGEDEVVKTRKTSIPEENDDDDEEEEYDSDHNGDDDNDEQNDGRVNHGYDFVEGKMGHSMEDYLVAKKMKMDGNNLAVYAIFDGHSGRDVAEYLKNNLFDTILYQPDFWIKTVTAVKKAYKSINEHILENIVAGHRGGSTAVTAILINGTKLIVANVGDSRAVLCMNDGEVRQITVDHDPLKERHFVESKGGFVAPSRGSVARVDGQLAMTRAFDDAKIKNHITAEPDVFIEDLNINHTTLLILASDGLWKVMSNEEASECIKGFQDGKEAARKLIEEAVGRGSQDDVSCIVVVLH